MTKRRTLLADLGAKLDGKQENLATEALRFILNQSPAARHAFNKHMRALLGAAEAAQGAMQPVAWETQVQLTDEIRPDLVGKDEGGRPILFVDSKFWAGLTEAQPVGYLQYLRSTKGLGLVFVAPANRIATLWPELTRRCHAAGIGHAVGPSAVSYERILSAPGEPTLAVASWDSVLTNLVQAAAVDRDLAAVEDINQLRGLCDRMEESGFMPLTSEELTGNWARRIVDFCGIVDDLTEALCDKRYAATPKLKQTSGRDYYCRYMLLKGNPAQISFHWGNWLHYGRTPFWLRVYGPTWKQVPALPESLRQWFQGDAPNAFRDDRGMALFPLDVVHGVDREAVLSSLRNQVVAIHDLLARGETTSAAIEDPPVAA